MTKFWTPSRIAVATGILLTVLVGISNLFRQWIPNDKLIVGLLVMIALGLIAMLYSHAEHTNKVAVIADVALPGIDNHIAQLAEAVGQISLIASTEEYYAVLGNAIEHANTRVDLLYLTKANPDSLGDPAKAYWQRFVAFAKARGTSLTIRRIASLDSNPKREWILKSTREVQGVPLYGLRCYLPQPSGTLPLIAVEVIDKREVFVFGPHNPAVRLHVTNAAFGAAMAEYFDQVWETIGTKFELKAVHATTINNVAEAQIAAAQL